VVRAVKLSPMCKTVLATVLVLAAGMLPAAQAPAPVTGVVFEDANGNGHRNDAHSMRRRRRRRGRGDAGGSGGGSPPADS